MTARGDLVALGMNVVLQWRILHIPLATCHKSGFPPSQPSHSLTLSSLPFSGHRRHRGAEGLEGAARGRNCDCRESLGAAGGSAIPDADVTQPVPDSGDEKRVRGGMSNLPVFASEEGSGGTGGHLLLPCAVLPRP